MTTLTENYYTGGFLVSEANGARARDIGSIANGTGSDVTLDAGLVVAQAQFGTAVVAAAGAGGGGANTGNGTLVMDATTPLLANVQVGAYTFKCTVAGTNSATFRVTDPKGDVLGDYALSGAGGSVTIANQLKVAVTDGSTDFVVGDGFTVTIPAGSGAWSAFLNTALQTKVGILFNRVTSPASGSRSVTIITRAAEVNGSELRYDASLTGGTLTAAKAAALAALTAAGIAVR